MVYAAVEFISETLFSILSSCPQRALVRKSADTDLGVGKCLGLVFEFSFYENVFSGRGRDEFQNTQFS